MKTTVIHHSADYDGLFCGQIARKFLPESNIIGWDFGDPTISFSSIRDRQVYVMDLPLDAPFGLKDDQLRGVDWIPIIWIDHHKTAIASHPSDIPGYRIDGVAACRLAWQWFTIADGNTPRVGAEIGIPIRPSGVLPMIQDYKNRNVNEPYAVRLAGEYDIWDKRDPNAELFQHGLRSFDLDEAGAWSAMLRIGNGETGYVELMLDKGKAIQYAKTQENTSIIKACGFTIQFEGFCLLACNAARYNSQLFTSGLKPEHDGMLGFNWDGKQWRVSLYTDKPGIDLSPIAVKYGGGGHAGACGFRAEKLPFLPC